MHCEQNVFFLGFLLVNRFVFIIINGTNSSRSSSSISSQSEWFVVLPKYCHPTWVHHLSRSVDVATRISSWHWRQFQFAVACGCKVSSSSISDSGAKKTRALRPERRSYLDCFSIVLQSNASGTAWHVLAVYCVHGLGWILIIHEYLRSVGEESNWISFQGCWQFYCCTFFSYKKKIGSNLGSTKKSELFWFYTSIFLCWPGFSSEKQ